jgi:hypothetical protein
MIKPNHTDSVVFSTKEKRRIKSVLQSNAANIFKNPKTSREIRRF